MAEAPAALRVVSPQELSDKEAARAEAAISVDKTSPEFRSELARFIHQSFVDAREFRQTERLEDMMLEAMRAYQGEYSASKLTSIKQFGGSEVYARLTAVKCRGASAILRDIFLSASDRPWELMPTPEPEVPDNVSENISQLVQTELATLAMSGQPISPEAIQDRTDSLQEAAELAARRNARKDARDSTRKLNDILVEGNFYQAFRDFLIDLPIFPFACIKGPTFRNTQKLNWTEDGSIEIAVEPKMFWDRVSPFDMYFSPGATNILQSNLYERMRFTRAEVEAMKGQPGYDDEAIDNVLDMVRNRGDFLNMWTSYFETERAELERRENPNTDSEDLFIDCIEFNGWAKGEWLKDWGLKSVKSDNKEYHITAWLIADELLKVQINPDHRQRPKYYISSFEKIPNALYGNGLPEILSDIQDVMNATLRALVNNMSIASGPQVIVNDDSLAANTDGDSLYPWKRWHTVTDPLGNNQPPVTFFQPNSNAQELLSVYKEFMNMADEVSALPRYLTGSQRTGGAASTASGLSMLMNNASKVMQQVAANIDEDVVRPLIEVLYEMVMLMEPGMLKGDEQIVVKGVTKALQQEQDRVRQLEFLQLTNNPVDLQIVGQQGRALLLREVAKGLGVGGEGAVPDDQQAVPTAPQASGGPGMQIPGPDEARSDGAAPRLDTVSNQSTVG